MKTLFDLYHKIKELVFNSDDHNQGNKPISFFVIDPRDSTKIIKMEWQQVMVDEEGTVIQLKVIT